MSTDPAILEAGHTLWRYHAGRDLVEASDAIVGLGSYDLRVAIYCAELFHARQGRLILFTGAVGRWTRGRLAGSEAAAFRDAACEHGVPATAIVCEEAATNIGENLRLSRPMLRAHAVASAILVTKPQTMRRVRATAPLDWPDLTWCVAAPAHDFEQQPMPGHALDDLLNEMVGDTARVLLYPRLGWQVAQPMPPDVRQAFDRLVLAGFDRDLPEGY